MVAVAVQIAALTVEVTTTGTKASIDEVIEASVVVAFWKDAELVEVLAAVLFGDVVGLASIEVPLLLAVDVEFVTETNTGGPCLF